MTMHHLEDSYGVVTAPATLTIRRRLPGPIDRVWRYLTDGDLRRQWLAAGAMDLKTGASFELVWRNDELSASAAERPTGFAEEQRMTSRVLAVEVPRHLSISWGSDGEVSFDLAEAGDAVLLTIVHRRIGDRSMLTMIGGGWHMHLVLLEACLAGGDRPSFWEGWTQLQADYDRRLPA